MVLTLLSICDYTIAKKCSVNFLIFLTKDLLFSELGDAPKRKGREIHPEDQQQRNSSFGG